MYKCLIVEDDLAARKLLQIHLSDWGQCDTAVNGQRAVEAFQQALAANQPYDLVCLDIMMPEMDGHQTLRTLRGLEEERGILGLDGVKVIMTTALRDSENVFHAFREGCEAYVVKPVRKRHLFEEMFRLGLASKPSDAEITSERQ